MSKSVIAPHRRAPFLGVLLACLTGGAALAADPVIITSVSKQFIVRGQFQRSAFAASAKDDFAYLDPATLAVTCERVRQAVARELGWGSGWCGNIFVNIHPLRFDNEPPRIIAYRTDRRWSYRINVPNEISRRRLLETIVETVLLEFADRNASQDSVELPPWLVEGFTAHLSQGPLAGIALQARSLQQISEEPRFRAAHTVKHKDVDQWLRKKLQTDGALTVDQLNWPEFEDNDEPSAEAYHYSAHLFVRELLRMRGGPEGFTATLSILPQHLNWQTAFLRGFQPHFNRMLDVEKWWSLTLTQLKSHDSSALWSSAQAQQKLEEILYTPMEVRLTQTDAPHVTPVALQTVINDWTYQQQAALLETKVGQLRAARQRCAPELAGLIDAYRMAIEKYLFARARTGRWFAERRARTAVSDASAELNALDERRASLARQPLAAKPAVAQRDAPQN